MALSRVAHDPIWGCPSPHLGLPSTLYGVALDPISDLRKTGRFSPLEPLIETKPRLIETGRLIPSPAELPACQHRAGPLSSFAMPDTPVADYLKELYLISGVSVPETSGYPALSKLLNAVGDSLKPKITAVICIRLDASLA